MQHQSWPCCVHEYNEWMAVVKRDYIVSDERLLLRTVVVVVCLFSCRSFVHVALVCFVVHQFELAYDVFRKCILRVYFWSGVFAPPALLTAACHRVYQCYLLARITVDWRRKLCLELLFVIDMGIEHWKNEECCLAWHA